jgi:hypothetical protein
VNQHSKRTRASSEEPDPDEGEGEHLTKTEIRELVKQAVEETLTSLGVAHGNPLEMQKDFSFMRELRVTSQAAREKGMLVLLGLLITAGASVVWMGIKQLLKAE